MDLTHVAFQGRSKLRERIAQRHAAARLRSAWVGPADPSETLALNPLAADVLTCAGLSPDAYRVAPLERRTSACLRSLRSDSMATARLRLYRHAEDQQRALSALLIGVTAFFRDALVFDAVAAHVLPALRHRDKPISIWSLGCSSGAELYSIAILLAEAGLLERAQFIGVDCRADAIASARSGRFSPEALDDVSPPIRSRYFAHTTTGWLASNALRSRMTWMVGDITRDLPAGTCDLALCRNVAIYLKRSAGEALFRRIAVRMAHGGFLVVGKAERLHEPLIQPIGRCLYRKHGA